MRSVPVLDGGLPSRTYSESMHMHASVVSIQHVCMSVCVVRTTTLALLTYT